ncbi:MAG: SRPBCC domain-containing protein [Prolixibacteraceae bacterium]|nr:SRPBCC domain-containing protein [Prolixibacteraceae bacterium]
MNVFEKTVKIKDLGFQVSISKVFSVSTETMWEFLLSEKGIAVWLGTMSIDDFEIQKPFTTDEGIEGKLTVFIPNCHLRLKWKPKHWEKLSTIELRVTNRKGRASVVFHQTGFFEIEKQEEMRTYWKSIILKMNDELIA